MTSIDFETPGNWTPGLPANDFTTNYAVLTGMPTLNQPTLSTDRSIGGLQFGANGGWILGGAQQLALGNVISVGATTKVSMDASALTSGTDTIAVSGVHLHRKRFLAGHGRAGARHMGHARYRHRFRADRCPLPTRVAISRKSITKERGSGVKARPSFFVRN